MLTSDEKPDNDIDQFNPDDIHHQNVRNLFCLFINDFFDVHLYGFGGGSFSLCSMCRLVYVIRDLWECLAHRNCSTLSQLGFSQWLPVLRDEYIEGRTEKSCYLLCKDG